MGDFLEDMLTMMNQTSPAVRNGQNMKTVDGTNFFQISCSLRLSGKQRRRVLRGSAEVVL